MKFIAKHGTTIDLPAWNNDEEIERCMVFDNLDPNHANSKTNAVYLSSHDEVTKFFANEKFSDPSSQLQVILDAVCQPKKPLVLESTPMDGYTFNDQFYIWPEGRTDLYEALKEDGYDAVIIKNGYNVGSEPATDVAILDSAVCQTITARIHFKNKWSEPLSKEDFKQRLGEIADLALDSDFAMGDMNSHDDENDSYVSIGF